MACKQIHILGTVGAGKSSLAQLLSAREGITLFPEPVETNPYLTKFYADPNRYAFHNQMFLMHSRYRQALEAQKLDACIMDMSIYGNDIFTDIMYRSGNMTDDDYSTFKAVSSSFKELLEPPTLMVYLQCSTDVAVQRIMRRGRPSELKATLDYWVKLNQTYEAWYESYNLSKKIVINVDNLDFVNKEEEEDYIIEVIMEALNGESIEEEYEGEQQ